MFYNNVYMTEEQYSDMRIEEARYNEELEAEELRKEGEELAAQDNWVKSHPVVFELKGSTKDVAHHFQFRPTDDEYEIFMAEVYKIDDDHYEVDTFFTDIWEVHGEGQFEQLTASQLLKLIGDCHTVKNS